MIVAVAGIGFHAIVAPRSGAGVDDEESRESSAPRAVAVPPAISLTGDCPDVLTTGQIARLTGVATRTVCKWIDGGALKGYRIPLSSARRVRRGDLLQFLRDHGMLDTVCRQLDLGDV